MLTTTVTVLCSDGTLPPTLHELIAPVNGYRYERLSPNRSVAARLDRGDVGLVLAHLTENGDASSVRGLLEEMAIRGVKIPVIVLSDSDDPELKLGLLQLGATACLSRPIGLSRIKSLMDVLTVRKRRELQELPVRTVPLAEEEHLQCGNMLFTAGMEGLLRDLRALAPLDATLLLTGETGTGKSNMARVIHELSPRRGKPFVVVEGGILSPSLLSSELFGHARGAFTGADCDHTGKFAEAQDGTILLDEVNSIPWKSQGSLLRAVEDRAFEPVGSNRSHPHRARLIVATNARLEEEVAAGRFRRDLYYRMKVVEINMPPLREQRGLIRPLAQTFLASFAARDRRHVQVLSPAALDALEGYRWPGNVRELRNVIERAVALCSGEVVDTGDLPEPIRPCGRSSMTPGFVPTSIHRNHLEGARKEAERKRLLEALNRHNNCRSDAAAELGISRVTLYKKLHAYGLS
jgi:DNA-binding NtrC family response regulator